MVVGRLEDVRVCCLLNDHVRSETGQQMSASHMPLWRRVRAQASDRSALGPAAVFKDALKNTDFFTRHWHQKAHSKGRFYQTLHLGQGMCVIQAFCL